MLSPRVGAAEVQDADLLAAEVEGHALAVGLVGEPGEALRRGQFGQQAQEVGAVALVGDVERVAVDGVPAGEAAVEGRGHQVADRLVGDRGNRLARFPRNRVGAQRVDDHDALAGDDEPAVERRGHPRRVVGVQVDVVAGLDLLQFARGRLPGKRLQAETERPLDRESAQQAQHDGDEYGSQWRHRASPPVRPLGRAAGAGTDRSGNRRWQ